MSKWIDESFRLTEEATICIKKAGGNPFSFDWQSIGKFLYACQCNSININRNADGTLSVTYDPDISYKENDE